MDNVDNIASVQEQLKSLEDRYEMLLARVRKIENSRSSSSILDDEERLMKYMALAYIASILLPPVIDALWSMFGTAKKTAKDCNTVTVA